MGVHEKCKQNTAFPVSNPVLRKQTRFVALVNALSAVLSRYAFWLCRDRGRAEELVLETFLRAWRSATLRTIGHSTIWPKLMPSRNS